MCNKQCLRTSEFEYQVMKNKIPTFIVLRKIIISLILVFWVKAEAMRFS
jgi:hypothetical protein